MSVDGVATRAKNNEKSQIDKKRITRADERCADLRAVDVPEGPTLPS